jgi:hypothetical protein
MIVGSAIRVGSIIVALPFPNRHSDCINYAISNLGFSKDQAISLMRKHGSNGQGFYDEEGRYYNRRRASIHAYECGQLPDKSGVVSESYVSDIDCVESRYWFCKWR